MEVAFSETAEKDIDFWKQSGNVAQKPPPNITQK
jgi:hypothetical protein